MDDAKATRLALRCWTAKLSSRIFAVVTVVPVLVFIGFEDYRLNGGSILWPLGVAGVAVLIVYLSAVRPRICVDERFVLVVNPLRRHRLSLLDVREVSPGYSGIQIVTDGKRVKAWAVQKTNLAEMFGWSTRSDAVVRELRSLVEAVASTRG